MKTYEGMFLLDAGNPNFEEAVAPVRAILARYGAEVVHLRKWDERRLAYEIRGRRRGLYTLAYFKVAPEKISEIEHDVQLNEAILRVLILTAEGVTMEQMTAPPPVDTEAASHRDGEYRHYDRGGRRDSRSEGGGYDRSSGPRAPRGRPPEEAAPEAPPAEEKT